MTQLWCEYALINDSVEADVLLEIDDGRFTKIEVGMASGSAEQLSGLSVPGLANAHSHAFHRALRSRTQTDRGTFWTWRDLMYSAAQRLNPSSYFRLARAVFAEMVSSGVSCVGEFHYIHHQPGGTPYADPNEMGSSILTAAGEAGLRITLLDTIYLHGGLQADRYCSPLAEQQRFADKTVHEWVERVDLLKPTIGQRLGAAIHSVRAVDPKSMATVAEWAKASDAVLHAHVSEQVAENQACITHHHLTPIEVMAEAGLLSNRFSAVHATHLEKSDVAALASSDATVVMCPTTERDLGDGIGPTAEFAAHEIPMAVGSDSHAVIDLFEESRALELDERLRSQSRGVHSAADLFKMASVNGHRSLGWTDAGTIGLGQRADLVALSSESIRLAGATQPNALEAAVFAGTASDVSDVFVDGRHVVSDGRHLTIDVVSELDTTIRELMDNE